MNLAVVPAAGVVVVVVVVEKMAVVPFLKQFDVSSLLSLVVLSSRAVFDWFCSFW